MALGDKLCRCRVKINDTGQLVHFLTIRSIYDIQLSLRSLCLSDTSVVSPKCLSMSSLITSIFCQSDFHTMRRFIQQWRHGRGGNCPPLNFSLSGNFLLVGNFSSENRKRKAKLPILTHDAASRPIQSAPTLNGISFHQSRAEVWLRYSTQSPIKTV